MSGKIIIPAHHLVSLIEGEPTVGVNYSFALSQIVHLHAPLNEWTFRHVEGRKFHLSVGGYTHTNPERHRVIVSSPLEVLKPNTEWVITWSKLQNGFTVTLPDNPEYGWRVEDDQLVIGKIITFLVLDQPYYIPGELFKFKGEVTPEVEKVLRGEI